MNEDSVNRLAFTTASSAAGPILCRSLRTRRFYLKSSWLHGSGSNIARRSSPDSKLRACIKSEAGFPPGSWRAGITGLYELFAACERIPKVGILTLSPWHVGKVKFSQSLQLSPGIDSLCCLGRLLQEVMEQPALQGLLCP